MEIILWKGAEQAREVVRTCPDERGSSQPIVGRYAISQRLHIVGRNRHIGSITWLHIIFYG